MHQHLKFAAGRDHRQRQRPDPAPSLEEEVVGCLPAFSVLREQLTDTVKQIETAVVQICASFEGIADRSQQSVQGAAQCLEGRGSGELIQVTRQTLGRLLQRMEQTRADSLRTIARMQEVQKGMLDIEKILKQVDAIARGTKILALNAKIEASRAGEQGKAFGVVANETSKVAQEARQTSTAIREIVQQVARDVGQMAEELQGRAQIDETQTQESQLEVDQTLDVLMAMHEKMRQSVEASGQNSEAVSQDIARAVRGLQFQDAVSQQVIHVVEVLAAIESVLGEHVDSSAIRLDGRFAHWAECLLRGTSMASERHIVEKKMGCTSGGTSSGGSIELF